MLMKSPGRRAPVPFGEQATPVEFELAAGAVAVLGAAALAPALPAGPDRFGLLPALVLLFAAMTGRVLLTLTVAGIGALVFDGFVIDSLGTLRWHGSADVARLALMLGAVVAGLVARGVFWAVRTWPRRCAASTLNVQGTDKEGRHG